MRVVGLMSGTSYDGIDAGVVDLALQGESLIMKPLGMINRPYPTELVDQLSAALPPANTTLEAVCRLDTMIGQAFAEAATVAIGELGGGSVDLIASHGQTVFHWVDGPSVRGTLQLGQPAWIAERTGIPVVSDFRPRDVAAGGQGAPLVSLMDVLWLRSQPRDEGMGGNPVALNLGGIANITTGVWDSPIAFDTGPANALIDAAVRDLSGGQQQYDRDGARAGRGSVHDGLLDQLLADPYYGLPAPKTTGKELFNLAYLQAALAAAGEVAPNDLVTTLTELTARTVAAAVVDHDGSAVFVSGGGTQNPTLMAALAKALGDVGLHPSDELGLASEAKEAYAFAVLGFMTVHQIAGSVASCTGARHSTVLGSITPGLKPLALPSAPLSAPTTLQIATNIGD